MPPKVTKNLIQIEVRGVEDSRGGWNGVIKANTYDIWVSNVRYDTELTARINAEQKVAQVLSKVFEAFE